MYQHFNDFDGELSRNWPAVLAFRPSWYKDYKDFQDTEIGDAWELYCNTKNSALRELLLGDVALRSDRPVLANFGTTSGTVSTTERGTNIDTKKKVVTLNDVTRTERMANNQNTLASEMRKDPDKTKTESSFLKSTDIEHMRKGSVLNDGYWWPFKNDAWVVGGVHGLKFFHLAMETVPDDLLWDSTAGRPRVLGRELIGIHSAGYKRVAHFVKDKTSGKLTEMMSGRALIGMVFAPQVKKTAEDFTFAAYYAALDNYKTLQSIKDMAFKTAVPYDSYDFAKVKGA